MNGDQSPSALPSGPAIPRPNHRWLGAALAATLAATAWFAWQDDTGMAVASAEPGRAAEGKAPRTASASPAGKSRPEAPWPEPIAPRRPPPTSIDAAAWSAAPARVEAPSAPTAQPVAPPAAPERVAPAFAYTLIGRLDDGRQRALLTGPRHSLAVQVGDIVDDEWRVDAVQPDGVTVTWLPGNSQQQIGFKAS